MDSDVVDRTSSSSLLTPLQDLLCAPGPLLALWEISAHSTWWQECDSSQLPVTEIKTGPPNLFSARKFSFSHNGTLPAKNMKFQWKWRLCTMAARLYLWNGRPQRACQQDGSCLFWQLSRGAALDWYCNILEYKAKFYWNLLPAAFSSHWDTITQKIHVQDTLLSSSPTLQALPLQTPPTFESTTNQAWRTTSDSTKRKEEGKGEEEEERVRKEGDKEGFKWTADAPGDVNDVVVISQLGDCLHSTTTVNHCHV